MSGRLFACISLRMRAAVVGTLLLLLGSLFAWMPDPLAVAAEGVELPIVMYHSVLRSEERSGKYVIRPQMVESDLAYLAEHGYTAVLPQELARAVQRGEPLPEKPVMITFDDGYLNNATYVLPLLERYHMKAVISVVGVYSENFSKTPDPNPNYAHLSWTEITALEESGLIEIGNHSYDMHRQSPRKGTRKKQGESVEEYYDALVSDTGKTQSLLEEHCGIVPTTYAYPFGHISPESVPILQEMGFTVLLTCTEKVNRIGSDPSVLLSLGRFNRPSGVSTAQFMKRMGIE